MQKIISLKLLPAEAENHAIICSHISAAISKNINEITGFFILKKSIDARSKKVYVNITVNAFINEPFHQRQIQKFFFKDVAHAKNKVLIIGAGPAGLFAALKLIEQGIQPIILERGKNVRERRRDLAILNKEGIINTESNYCFGEGGAGTYSDGKLYTRSSKRGDVSRILNLFVQFGADEKILYESHPHIGTNKLPQIITAMREKIIECGGNIFFEKKAIDFVIENGFIKTIVTADGNKFSADYIILATGHSARDIFQLLHEKKIFIGAKPFALGVRVEHPQSLIDAIQYHYSNKISEKNYLHLPAASYSLVQQINGRGVFSFCMCPGGIIAPASTNANELVINGWSPSKRNNFYANSGIVVPVETKDAFNYLKKFKIENEKLRMDNPLLLMHFQKVVEKNAFIAGGGRFVAPAQRMVDFCNNKISSSLPGCSYVPGIKSAQMQKILPSFIYKNLQQAFQSFNKKMQGYFTNEAVVVATESRTSSPVRIPRDEQKLYHPQIKNLYPCSEGAGYAGGIISAAMDGEKVATIICVQVNG
ncbi:MAG: NAD(P)/FAD-dependent oxidoreductase [Chitinophagaceae bacterium]